MAENKILRQGDAIYVNTHLAFSYILPDITTPTADDQQMFNYFTRFFHGGFVDDDGVDAGDHDFLSDAALYIADAAPAKINKIEPLGVPGLTMSPDVALTNFKVGNPAGATGFDNNTQIDITNILHNITEGYAAGPLAVFGVAQNINWIATAALTAEAIVLATVQGDATKAVLVVLPDGVEDYDGNPTPGLRVFYGGYEFSRFSAAGLNFFARIIEFMLHQTKNTAVARIIEAVREQLAIGVQRYYPDLVAQSSIGVVVQTAAANFTYGNYTPLLPAATVAVPFKVVAVNIAALSDVTEQYQVELSRLSDNTVISIIRLTASAQQAVVNIPVHSPVIAAGEGVRARLAKSANAGSAKTITISLGYAEMS